MSDALHAGPAPGSDRRFGILMAAVCAGVAAWLYRTDGPSGVVTAMIAATIAAIALAAPHRLHAANRVWFALGMVLARIVNPIVIGAMFFLVVTPVGLLMRALGKRPLELERDPKLATYWIERGPARPERESMRDQF